MEGGRKRNSKTRQSFGVKKTHSVRDDIILNYRAKVPNKTPTRRLFINLNRGGIASAIHLPVYKIFYSTQNTTFKLKYGKPS